MLFMESSKHVTQSAKRLHEKMMFPHYKYINGIRYRF